LPFEEFAMSRHAIVFAAVVAAGFIGTAAAQGVKPIQYQGVALGEVNGDFYYTVAKDGYHVVATFAQRGDKATPLRFETVLAPGQAVTISTPRAAGQSPDAVEISRQNGQVYMHRVSLVD
jgi:hypothetical protein